MRGTCPPGTLLLCLVLCLVLCPVTAQANAASAALPPKHRVVLNNLLVLRLNPVGIEDQVRAGYQLRLSDRTDLLFRDTFVFFGIAPKLNPAFAKIGPSIEVQPLSILNLRVGAEYMGFFSSFGFLQSFPTAAATYSDVDLKDGQDAHRNYAAHGAHVIFEPLLQLKLGPIALRNRFSVEYWYMDVRPGDTVFYESTLDTLVPANGWILANDLDLLYVSKFRLVLGVRYSVVKPLYADAPPDFDNEHQRIGPLVAYTFFDRGYTRFNKPTLLLIVNWYVEHRYRTGAAATALLPGVFVNSPALPYVVLGFAFQSGPAAAARGGPLAWRWAPTAS